jgi:hypothetical protein
LASVPLHIGLLFIDIIGSLTDATQQNFFHVAFVSGNGASITAQQPLAFGQCRIRSKLRLGKNISGLCGIIVGLSA